MIVRNPGARHNLGVALLTPGFVTFEGSVGYYCAGMSDGASVRIRGSAGWGVAEGLLGGLVTIEGNAGNGAAASIRPDERRVEARRLGGIMRVEPVGLDRTVVGSAGQEMTLGWWPG